MEPSVTFRSISSLWPKKSCHTRWGEIHISLHTAVGTHHLDGAVAPFGERGHGKIDGGAAVQLDIYHLVVHNVVVAVINTAAVGAGAQRLLDVLGCGVRVQHVNGPVHAPRAYAGAAALQIIPHRVVGTAGAHSAVHAALRRARGGFFRTEQIIVAVRAYIARPLARKPDENVHIVAALCQDHRAGFVRSAPVAAHIAVRLMPVAHLFHGLDGYHLADAAVLDVRLMAL